MENKFKNAFNKKMDVQPSSGFDDKFMALLKQENSKPKFFSSWVTWVVSGCATASVLFIAINLAPKFERHSFNHQEYVESVLEIQRSFNEDVSTEETMDLTTAATDEI